MRRLHRLEVGGPPELRLVRAVLDDALQLVLGEYAMRRTPRALHDVRTWVLAEDTSYLFSFLRVCEALDLDSARLRAFLAPHLGLPSPLVTQNASRRRTA